MSDDLITIGTFSLLTGLSITTLRHYDDIGLVVPTEVDGVTGYRRYSTAQVDRARRVRLLREAEVPTALMADAVDGTTPIVRRCSHASVQRCSSELNGSKKR